jgi:hypothetical protein
MRTIPCEKEEAEEPHHSLDRRESFYVETPNGLILRRAFQFAA